MASSALSIRSTAQSTATLRGQEDTDRDEQCVDLWVKGTQKCRDGLKKDYEHVVKVYRDLALFPNVSLLSSLGEKDKKKLESSRSVIEGIDKLVLRCTAFNTLYDAKLELPGCVLAYLAEVFLIEKADNGVSKILDHEVKEFLLQLHMRLETLNSFPSHVNITKETVETLSDMALLFTEMVTFIRAHATADKARFYWPKKIDHKVDFLFKSIDNRITMIRFRSDAKTNPESVAPAASIQEVEIVHAAEPPPNPKTCYYLPMPKIPNFLGREEQMESLRNALDHDHNEGLPQRRIATLWGEGGIGKTQLALHYAIERKQRGIPYIFWISSESLPAVDKSFSAVAVELQLPGVTGHGNHINNKYLAMQFLNSLNEDFLIIYDNIETDEDFDAIRNDSWPTSLRASLLLTSRHDIVSLDTIWQSFRVPVLSNDEAKTLLLQTSQRTENGVEGVAARHLAERLDGLPLALVIMGMNIKKQQKSVGKFLEMYDKHPTKVHLKSQKSSGIKQYYQRGGLHGAYQLSFDNLIGSPAWALFRVLSLLGPDAIPMTLFQPESSSCIPDALAFCLNEWDLQEEINTLLDASLARSSPETSLLYVHRVIQVEFQSTLLPDEMQEGFMHASTLLYEAFPKLINGLSFRHIWKQCEAFASHIVALCHVYQREKYKPRSNHEFDELVKCLDSCAWYFKEIGDFAQGEFLVKTGFDLCKNEKSPEYCSLLNTAGIIATRRNNIPKAYEYHEKCLKARIELFGEDHEEVANSYNNLGNTYQCDCRWVDAVDSYTKALKIDLTKPEEEHKQIVNIRYSNIAEAFIQLGEYEKAVENLTKSRKAAIDVFGEDTFYDADVDWIMGHMHYRKGDLAKAKTCYTRTWEIYSDESASSMSTVAALYKVGCVNLALGDAESACRSLKKALELSELNRNVKGDGGEVARVKRKYADALRLRKADDDEALAKKFHEEAEKERKILQKGNYADLPDEERSYNLLVAVYYRGTELGSYETCQI